MTDLLVTAGTGPVEVRWFVAALADALGVRLAAGSRTTVGPEDAPRSVVLAVEGDATPWIGTHALVRRSERRGRQSRRRWYAAVSTLPALAEVPALDPGDVVITATRSGGPGGQHVNTTSSAVIARHVPTGIVVRVEDERSQHANRRRALVRLAEALARQRDEAVAAGARTRWLAHRELVRGAPVWTWREGRDGLEEERCERT